MLILCDTEVEASIILLQLTDTQLGVAQVVRVYRDAVSVEYGVVVLLPASNFVVYM